MLNTECRHFWLSKYEHQASRASEVTSHSTLMLVSFAEVWTNWQTWINGLNNSSSRSSSSNNKIVSNTIIKKFIKCYIKSNACLFNTIRSSLKQFSSVINERR